MIASILSLLLLGCLLLAPARGAQSAAQTSVLPLGVYDSNGQLVQGINPGQIRLKGVPAKVRSLQVDSGPRRIILLIDVSGSMSNQFRERRWENAKRAAEEFLSAVRPDDQLALHVFATRHEALVPYTHDFRLLSQRIQALPEPETRVAKRAHGHLTRLGEALADILASQQEPQFGDVIVLVSDGEFGNEDNVDPLKLRPHFAAAGLRVFLLRIAMPQIARFTSEYSLGSTVAELRRAHQIVNFLPWQAEDLVEATGGAVVDPWDPVRVFFGPVTLPIEFIREAARKIYAMVHTVYRLELEALAAVKKPHKLQVELVDPRAHKMGGAELTFPHYLTPHLGHADSLLICRPPN